MTETERITNEVYDRYEAGKPYPHATVIYRSGRKYPAWRFIVTYMMAVSSVTCGFILGWSRVLEAVIVCAGVAVAYALTAAKNV